MRQTLMVVTCDKCGVQATFEIVNQNAAGPIVATMDPVVMLERRGWTNLANGLRPVDICEKCKETLGR
jgi:hypothetical protein